MRQGRMRPVKLLRKNPYKGRAVESRKNAQKKAELYSDGNKAKGEPSYDVRKKKEEQASKEQQKRVFDAKNVKAYANAMGKREEQARGVCEEEKKATCDN